MTPNQVFWHRIWLSVAALLVVAAYVNGFRISHVILSSSYRLSAVLVFASSFCAAKGVKVIVNDSSDSSSLWYASFSSFILTSLILAVFVVLSLTLMKTFLDPAISRTSYLQQMQFLLPALAILWIVILDRPFRSGTSSHQWNSFQDAPNKRSCQPSARKGLPREQKPQANSTLIRKVRDKLHQRNGLLKRKQTRVNLREEYEQETE